jgi:hypothetical protein
VLNLCLTGGEEGVPPFYEMAWSPKAADEGLDSDDTRGEHITAPESPLVAACSFP